MQIKLHKRLFYKFIALHLGPTNVFDESLYAGISCALIFNSF